MSLGQNDNYLILEFTKLKEENSRLKAEVDRLTFDPMTYLDDQGEWMPRHIHLASVERLKAEVEHLTNENGNNIVMKEEWYLKCLSARAEVERLRKELSDAQENYHIVNEMVAKMLKEGKQS